MKFAEVQARIEAAGFTVIKVVRAGRWFEVEKNGEKAAILYQHPSAWHWFSKAHAATASDSSAERCDRGGLGDAISDDRDMRQYKKLMYDAPDRLLREYQGVYAASCQVYND